MSSFVIGKLISQLSPKWNIAMWKICSRNSFSWYNSVGDFNCSRSAGYVSFIISNIAAGKNNQKCFPPYGIEEKTTRTHRCYYKCVLFLN